ncbi:MAG: extracellular solute-binding protein [Chloroflexi bacterium]|nr:extracellular solute-binding protein [Chloroflexota bacterium]
MTGRLSRRAFLGSFAAGAMSVLLGACTKVVKETVVVEKVVKETVEVEKIVKEEVQKEVTRVVEKAVEKEVTRVVPAGELRGEVLFWAWDEPISDLLKKGFETKYPEVKVEYEMPQNYTQTFLASLVAGAGLPDCAWIDSNFYQKLARTGQLIPMDEYLEPYKADILKFLWDGGLYEGVQYGVPRRYAPEVLWYRKDRYEEVGIDPESLKTWDDFMLEGKKAVDGTRFMSTYDRNANPYILQSMIFSKDGTGFFDSQDNVVVNSPENVACLEKFMELVKSGVLRQSEVWSPDWYNAAHQAIIACLVMPYWYGSEPRVEMPDTAGKWGILRIPSLKPGVQNASIWQGAMFWVIPKQAKNKEMGWRFSEYTTFDYTDPFMQESMDREFVLPAYVKFMEIDYFWGDALLFFGENLRKLAHELAQGAPVNYLPPEYSEAESALVAEMQALYDGERSAQATLDAAAEAFKKLLEAR